MKCWLERRLAMLIATYYAARRLPPYHTTNLTWQVRCGARIGLGPRFPLVRATRNARREPATRRVGVADTGIRQAYQLVFEGICRHVRRWIAEPYASA